MQTGKLIANYLIDNGISQTFISNKTGIPLPRLNLSLNGKRKLTFSEYELICGVLNLNTNKFLTPKKPQPKKGK